MTESITETERKELMFCNIFYQMLWENVVLIYSNQVTKGKYCGFVIFQVKTYQVYQMLMSVAI